MNYIHLNKNIQRRGELFTGTEAIRKKLNKNSQCFLSADFVSVYFQIHIHTADQELTTFITPYGRFCFLSLPRGLNDLMESFKIMTDFIISNIPKTVKSVDNII